MLSLPHAQVIFSFPSCNYNLKALQEELERCKMFLVLFIQKYTSLTSQNLLKCFNLGI